MLKGDNYGLVFSMFTCVKKLNQFAALKQERGRRAGKRRDGLKLEKLSSRLVKPLAGLALNMSLTIKLTAMLA